MLSNFGMTPSEWGELDATERYFLESASMEYNKRMNNDNGI